MLHIVTATTWEAWHFPYGLYILWVAGIMGFYLLASSERPMADIDRMQRSCIGALCLIWMGLSMLAVGFAWPLLLGGPLMLVVHADMPWLAAVLMLAYTCFAFWSGGQMLMERFAPRLVA